MKKTDVKFHSDGCCQVAHPAINVKVRKFPTAIAVAERLKCTEDEAQKALEIAWDAQCEAFWDVIASTEIAEGYFGPGTSIVSEGRSSGWVVVLGLPEWESWDAIQLAKWRRFEKLVLNVMKDLCSLESVCETIQFNSWCKS